MLWCRIVLATGVFGLFVVQDSLAGASRQNQPPATRTVSNEARAACEVAYTIASKTPGVSVQRRTGTFSDETLRGPVFGCGLAISGSFERARATGDVASRLRQEFSGRAWQEMLSYSADGTDGTSFAFRKAGVACLVRGVWDGGSDDDPKIAAADWYKVTVLCTSPEFPERRAP